MRINEFNKPYSTFKSAAGFTLIELILAVFMFALIAAGVAGLSYYYLKSYSFSLEENQAIGLAQTALTTMIREIREARISETGAWPIIQTDDNTLIYYGDVTNDGRADRVRYFLSGNDLKKGVIEPTQPPVTYPIENEKISTLAAFVDNAELPLFKYYNGSWPADVTNNPLSATNRLLNARYLTVYIRINISPNTGSQPFALNSGVQIRSLKDNL